jgi:LSD1 subclass zinc finger protein
MGAKDPTLPLGWAIVADKEVCGGCRTALAFVETPTSIRRAFEQLPAQPWTDPVQPRWIIPIDDRTPWWTSGEVICRSGTH